MTKYINYVKILTKVRIKLESWFTTSKNVLKDTCLCIQYDENEFVIIHMLMFKFLFFFYFYFSIPFYQYIFFLNMII